MQSENYHLNQVSLFVHDLYKHAQVNVDDVDSTTESHNVIKNYHFYISDEHETLCVQHLFVLIYESFRKNHISFTQH